MNAYVFGRLTVDRVFIALPVMAYSVGLERPFPTFACTRCYNELMQRLSALVHETQHV
jgi:hypothetical protein